jgi:hypothetical protein
MDMKNNERTNLANQAKLDCLIREALSRIPVGSTINNKRGTARWNGTVWVYGR